jgi:hypothetical protein
MPSPRKTIRCQHSFAALVNTIAAVSVLKTDLEVVSIKAEAMSRTGKRVLFHGKGGEVGLCWATWAPVLPEGEQLWLFRDVLLFGSLHHDLLCYRDVLAA